MAVGSSESCIRMWSLQGEKLKARSLDSDNQVVEDEGLAMRKLIGHTAPVYSMSYDPIYGSSQKPSTLLSASGDGTVRLWSLDTYTNLVAYRGHNRDPVWDVEWGPMGVYFASASRDRTAKLWSSDRVTPLRMYTGHLSDVNVSLGYTIELINSVCDSILILCTSLRDLMMRQSGYGMFSVELVFDYSSVTRMQSPP
jgi:transcription initiation factor TFIID subunit 5